MFWSIGCWFQFGVEVRENIPGVVEVKASDTYPIDNIHVPFDHNTH